jgi:CSLREA domain-containing protein
MMAVVLASPAQAAKPLIVNSSTDANDGACTTRPEGCTLREAINAANAAAGQADTIEFDLGQSATISLCQLGCDGSGYGLGPLPVITDSAGLTIDGQSADIKINGNYSNTLSFAVLVFRVGSDAGLNLNNLTVTQGNGGVFNEGTLTVHNATFSGNYGGGIHNSGTATVNDSTFSGNYNGDSGGGIHNSGELMVNDTTFSGNYGDYYGGGIMNEAGTLEVSSSTFSNNSAPNVGGGIMIAAGTATVNSSTFSGNDGGGSGGGIFAAGIGTLVEVSNSTFSGNSAAYGGGISTWDGTLEVSNSTISGNSAVYGGGGIDNSDTARLQNTIVANNTSGDTGTENCSPYTGITDGGYNLDSGNTCGFSAVNHSLSGVTASELMLGPLQDNGGPTETMALLDGSKAIDQGKAFGATTDQRGQTRPSDILDIPNATDGDASDIGAFEALAPNVAPTVAVARSGSCGTNDLSGTLNLTVDDPDGPEASLSLSASSSKPTLVPNSNVTFGGTGADRTLTATAASGKSGTAVLTVTVTDSQQLDGAPLTVKVRVGGNGNDTLVGDANSDVLLGQNANDTLRGAAGKDLMCGGRGDDRLRGGTEADFFGGGPGSDMALDFNAGEGDTKDSTIP